MLAFFRNYSEQLEILVEGGNPQAGQLLPQADVDLIRNHLNRDERICAYVSGRAVGAGRVIWVVTTQSLLVVHTSQRPSVRKHALERIERADAEQGRYGTGMSVLLPGMRLGLYGASHAFALLALSAIDRPAAKEATQVLLQAALSEEARAHALHAVADLTLRAQPLLAHSDAEAQLLLQQTAARAKAEGQYRAPEAV